MEIEKFHWKTEEAFNRIKQGRPVVLKECPIVYPFHEQWTWENIASYINEDFPCDVFTSPTKTFPYWDLAKNTYQYDFTPPTTKISMTFREFLLTAKTQEEKPVADRKYHYLHQSLVAEMGPKILEEYSKFSLQTAALYKLLANWGELTHNLLLCGCAGYTTPIHYDEQENLFTQLQGVKRVRLFSPRYWYGLYPFPNGHPRDRQGQVTLPFWPGETLLEREEERFRFPAFASIGKNELYTDLEPGEVLYIPQYWFHQMEALTDNVSLSWWFKHTNRGAIDYQNIKLDELSLVVVRRNIENAMAQMAGFGPRAHRVFLSIASGRTKIPGIAAATPPSSSGVICSSSSSSTGKSSSSSGSGSKTTNEDKVAEVIIQTTTVENNQKKTVTTPEFVATEILVADSDAGTLTLPDGDEETCRHIAHQALSMLSTLFPSEMVGGVLLQVVAGRFHFPNHSSSSLSAGDKK